MEVSGIAFRPLPCVSGAGFRQNTNTHFTECSLSGLSVTGNRPSCNLSLKSCTRDSRDPVWPSGFSGRCEFSNNGHLRYYAVSSKCGGKKEKEKNSEATAIKKKLKLIKGLSRDLSNFSGMGFGVESGDSLVGEVKGKMISQAAEVLLEQLQHLRAKEKDIKRKRKEEKAAKKATRMKNMAGRDTSLSSSSESSDSECGEVVDMSRLRSAVISEPKIEQPPAIQVEAPITVPILSTQEQKVVHIIENPSSQSSFVNEFSARCSNGNSVAVGTSNERIEVCMGGKCKKSGAVELLEEFERKVGIEGAVVGCKCMGKCRDGPNVRVLNCCDGSLVEKMEGAIKPATNPLCIGVSLDDVGVIVANFFGENRDVSLVAA